MNNDRFLWPTQPLARRENQVIGTNCRFSVLTDFLIRMEYDKNNVFEDRASQTVFYRDLGEATFSATREDGFLYLETAALVVTYQEGTPFSSDTLSVRLKHEPASQWKFGEDFEDLGGTAKTLDLSNGDIPLGRGVCSRFGFSVLNDTNSLVLGENGWVEVRADDTLDYYFFGYGYDYLGAVRDFFRLTGAPPLLPAYALGNWWSRYYSYSQQQYMDLMNQFKAKDLPFSVAVIDMDWHIVDIPEEQQDEEPEFKSGWTGYTWNKDLFPDHKAFLRWLKDNHLHNALNLHPAQGVRKHEAMYEQAALAAGIDPKSGQRVPFDILSPKAMADYFDILLHPYEEDGVNFWWMDWQQGENYWWIHQPNKDGILADPREKLDPLWMLNHLHILDISKNGKRPMFFSRFSGPGSQRYPIGFSGDCVVSWDTLKFQPYFTATASNIGYCWWSHDIGGHMFGCRDDQLTARWVQLGVFSPINRLHSTKGEFLMKEPWSYGSETERCVGNYLRLRHRLFPYLYTMNYHCHKELLPLVQPMYYSHPKNSAAYEVPNQFWFGSELMVAAITEPNDPVDRLGRAQAWQPKGDWFDFETGLYYHSERGRKMDLFRDIDHYPVLARAGAIVPMKAHHPHDNRLINDSEMELLVFPGADNSFTLYEDCGEYYDYRQGACATTRFDLDWGNTALLTIHAAQGDPSVIPQSRTWTVRLRGFDPSVSAAVLVDGAAQNTDTTYSESDHTLTLLISASTASTIEITLSGERLIHNNTDVPQRIFDLLCKAQLSFKEKDALYALATDPRKTLRVKRWLLGDCSPQAQHTVKAIRELLTLTQEEYAPVPS